MGSGTDNDRYVVPNKDRGGWDIVKEDHERSSAHTDTKKEAVDRAREIVEDLGGGEVRQTDQRGRLSDSDSTKHGHESKAPDRK